MRGEKAGDAGDVRGLRMSRYEIKTGRTLPVFRDDRYSYNFPCLERLSDGSLYCVARQITGLTDSVGRIRARRSFDGGVSWEDMPSPALGDEALFPEKGYMCPNVREYAPGELIAVYLLVDSLPGKPLFHPDTDGMQKTTVRTAKSFDYGRSWTAAVNLEFSLPDLIVPGKGLRLPDGSFGFPCEVHDEWDKGYREGPTARFILSRDRGESFPEGFMMASHPGYIFGDARLTVDDEGALISYFWCYNLSAQRDEPLHRSVSRDMGRGWSEPVPINLRMQITSPWFIRRGLTLCLTQDRFSEAPGLRALLSFDEGMSWDMDGGVLVWDAGGSRPDSGNPFGGFEQFRFGFSSIQPTGENTALAVYWHSGGAGTMVSVTGLSVE